MSTSPVTSTNVARFESHRLLASFVAAVLFGVGLVVAGMTTPSKVVGFLDVFGAWDPSLALVMMGAIAVHTLLYRLTRKRSAPLFDFRFHVPDQLPVDGRLLVGAALFGVGWGLAGICPGPGVVAAAGAGFDGDASSIFIFVGAMAVGMALFTGFERWRTHSKRTKAPEVCPG